MKLALLGALPICLHKWSNRREGITTFTLIPSSTTFKLEFTFRDIIVQHIACNIIQCISLFDIRSFLSDNNTEFDFPIGLHRIPWDHHLIIRPNQGSRRLHKDDWFCWNLCSSFLRMVFIVQANTYNLGWSRKWSP